MEAKISVLLADAGADFRLLLREALERTGEFQVVGETGDGGQVLTLVEETHPQILLLDTMLPVLDGMGALQRIAERWPKTQIILLSGHADMQLAVQAMTQGAFGYLMKPVDFDDLLFKIEDAAMQSRLEYGNEATGR